VDPDNLQPANLIRNPNINLTIKAAKAAQGRVNAVGAISGTHDNDMCTRLQTIHKC
jgi:hypothetical protein